MNPSGSQRGPDTADGGDTNLPRWDDLSERWLMFSPLRGWDGWDGVKNGDRVYMQRMQGANQSHLS
jgi:hypothetical protein